MGRRKIIIFVSVISGIMLILIILLGTTFTRYNSNDQTAYSAKSFGIETLKSQGDMDKDGIDDYTDIWLSARAYIETKPKYKSKYYEDGYPNDGYGVCTDVIWQAFTGAGYNLKELIDEDIKENSNIYHIDSIDPNIDFRRVKNLNVFFERNAISLPLNFLNPEEWQAGDIVVFTHHIAICSDTRNKSGIPFIIHHDSKGAREKNNIDDYKIIGHYRWE
jgi:hypothetical protein